MLAEDKHVVKTLTTFEEHLKEHNVDVTQTPYLLGQELVIDPKTELSTDAAANRLFTREYRKGYELPRV